MPQSTRPLFSLIFHTFIREISIIDGGLGCAIWDAAIIMSRWVNKQAATFKDSTVIGKYNTKAIAKGRN